MVDRAPTKPNRYAVYDENHNFIRYEYHERADEPTQVGDALNKANLLPDDVATALGLTGNPQVKDALSKLKTLADIGISRAQIVTGSYTGTGTYGQSNPKSLSFSNSLYLLFISPAASNVAINPTVLIRDATFSITDANINEWARITQSWSDKSVSWYNTNSAARQLNESGVTYNYAAVTI